MMVTKESAESIQKTEAIKFVVLICKRRTLNMLVNEKWLRNLHPHNPYPTAFPYGNGIVLHFYQQQESSTTKTVHKVINRGLKTYV